MKEYIIENIYNILVSVLGGGSFLAYITERKKRRIEENQLASNALKSMQEAYDTFTQDSLRRYNDLSEEVLSVRTELSDVYKELTEERKKNMKMVAEYENIHSSYKKVEEKNRLLMEDIEKIKIYNEQLISQINSK